MHYALAELNIAETRGDAKTANLRPIDGFGPRHYLVCFAGVRLVLSGVQEVYLGAIKAQIANLMIPGKDHVRHLLELPQAQDGRAFIPGTVI